MGNIIDELGLSLLKEKTEECNALRNRHVSSSRDGVIETINLLSSCWRTGKPMITPLVTSNGYEDPVFKYIYLPAELRNIFHTPLVQRMNYINQLSFAYFAYPMANHSRLAHSLGTSNLIRKALRRMFAQGKVYTKNGIVDYFFDDETQKRVICTAQLVALLHDIGHGPFGHALDKYVCFSLFEEKKIKKGYKHLDKYYTPKYVRDCLKHLIGEIKYYGDNCLVPDNVIEILEMDKSSLDGLNNLIGQLIDSALDVDRIDYILRDSYTSGLTQGLINVEALLHNMVIFKDDDGIYNLAYNVNAMPHIEHLLYARDIMFLYCYEHGLKVCGDRLIEKALINFVQEYDLIDHFEDILLLTDQQLVTLILSYATEGMDCFKIIKNLIRGLEFEELLTIRYRKTQENNKEINGEIPEKTIEKERKEAPARKNDRIKEFAKKTTYGDLREAYYDLPETWERDIAAKASIERWKIHIVLASHETIETKEESAYIVVPNGKGFDYKQIREVPNLMSNRNEVSSIRSARNRVRVFIYSGCTKEEKENAKEFAFKYLTEER